MMKKYTYYLILFSMMFFGQLQASIYPNYSQSIGVSSLNNSAQSGTGGGTISINNDILTISISANWYSSLYIKIGTVVALTVSPSIPDMELGPVLSVSGGSTGVYLAKIENNTLVFYLTYAPTSQTGCSLNFTKNLACIIVPTWYADNDLDGLGDPLNSVIQCTQPDGNYVLDNTDNCPLLPGTNASCTILEASLKNQNYIKKTIYKVKTATSINVPTITQANQNITYFDGLGRPIQSIGIKQSGITGKDIITHIDYDAFGRQAKDYLPYVPSIAGDEGSFRIDALSATNTFYTNNYSDDIDVNDPNPYSEKLFEDSPLNRVSFQGAPGQSWKAANTYYDHAVQFQYETNTATEVKKYKVYLSSNNNTYTPTLVLDGNYNLGELYKTITKDENHTYGSGLNYTTEEFKNKQGQVVLKRTYNAGAKHDTYYVYDDYGNLTYVIPPKVEVSITTAILDELCYQYKYDNRNRLVEKKIPGKGWEYIVYNKLDQPILTQDANLKAQSKWLFTKYDVFGRVAYTGLISSGGLRPTLQTAADVAISQFVIKNTVPTTISGTTIYYNNDAYPNVLTTDELLTINYYDNYTFDKDILTIPSISEGQAIVNYNNLNQTLTKGLETGSKVRVLGTTSWITTITGYDAKARPIYVASRNNYLLTTDVVTSLLDFVGKVDKITTSHSKGTTSIITENLFTYDHTGRLKKQTQELNNTNVLEVIVENTYDELGQLIIKGVGGKTSRLQTVNYAYNIRGWLKQINDPNILGTDLFGFKINYNTVSHGATQLYNGNISETEWKTQNDNVLRWYKYGYDNLNRITSGIDNTADTRYSLSTVAYDKNGNIANLTRRGQTNVSATTFGVMDQLTYTYQANSNKLTIVSDAGNDTFGFKDDQIGTGADITTDYTYDANGNLLSDANKGITSNILYNHLNLPTKVTFASGNIAYIYDATGVKLEKVVTEGTAITRTKYAGNFIYEKIGTAADVLKFFNTSEGYVEPNGGTGYNYVYQYKDHLGNIRLSYSDKNNNGVILVSTDPSLTEIVEENNYYPFGLEHKGYNNVVSSNANSVASKFKYNGVEHEEALGLDWYEMDVRSYDPAIGRFTSIDLVTHFDYSTYSAFDNNPVFWADPSGADSESNTQGAATDMWGRARYDKWGGYIPPYARTSADQNGVDAAAVFALKEVANRKFYVDGKDFSNLSESDKQKVFKTDELGTIGILLWEFATGTGKEVRKFDVGVHPFADRLMEGRILGEIVNEFNDKARGDGYDFTKVGNSKEYKLALEFSPNINPTSWLESLSKHLNSNSSQFFVGGAVADVKIQDRNLIIQIYNETSRSSLMLHIGEDYNRKNGNKPLSTIKQYINASYKLSTDEKK